LKALRIAIAVAAITAAAATATTAGLHDKSTAVLPAAAPELPRVLPTEPDSYLGVYADGAPGSYAGLTSFMRTTGTTPNVVMYYSGWREPFEASFAKAAAKHGAVLLVQIEPNHVSLNAIAAGRYDEYLISYASAVEAYGNSVILSFGHEMNGDWYSWGKGKTTPAAFVAAWRHIVNVFRKVGAENVTWMWTVNVTSDTIPNPEPWWPGAGYVTWVGIDGYYLEPSFRFTSLFGHTISQVKEFTSDPILISETGAAPAAGQAGKIADLATGVQTYGLLGFVWFDFRGKNVNSRIDSPKAAAAFHDAAKAEKGRVR
jgi:mannan endo-1,4-beta-mannosidase